MMFATNHTSHEQIIKTHKLFTFIGLENLQKENNFSVNFLPQNDNNVFMINERETKASKRSIPCVHFVQCILH